ncbi:MAG TPA: hypothetical protein VFV87_01900 [Pirellulaceae bacterium]|nr:hypothetical protein [Pirellulaceae bacterium]
MWTRIVQISPALAALLYSGVLMAQDSVSTGSGNLLHQVKWLRLEVIGGRIVAHSDRCSQNRYSVESSASGHSRQTLNLETQAATLVVRYENIDAQTRLLLELNERGQLSIERTGGPDSQPDVSYFQAPCGKVKLTVGGTKPRTIIAENLWQLLLAERDLCRERFLPLLDALRPNWQLEEQLDDVEATLMKQAGANVLAQRRQWQIWVDQLATGDYSQRQAADRALRQVGQPVLAFLLGLDATSLDGEQRRRVRTMLRDLPDGSADSPLRVADWLAADKRVWLALMARGEVDQRIAAAEHLSKLCRRPLVFDPQATAEARQAQLAELSAKLVEN